MIALVESARSGDRAAHAELVTLFEPVVYGLSLARLAPDVAQDVVHDVFVVMLDKLGSLRDPAALKWRDLVEPATPLPTRAPW